MRRWGFLGEQINEIVTIDDVPSELRALRQLQPRNEDVPARSVRPMSVRMWAIKPGELKALDRRGRLIFAARCAMRVERWLPPKTSKAWNGALQLLAASAFGQPHASELKVFVRTLNDSGAIACNRLAQTDEPLGRCMNYATTTLALGLEATLLPDGPRFAKAIVDVAKNSASIAAVLAHAGRVRAPKGADAVEFACTRMWNEIRADVPLIAAAIDSIATAANPVAATRAVAAVWQWEKPEPRN